MQDLHFYTLKSKVVWCTKPGPIDETTIIRHIESVASKMNVVLSFSVVVFTFFDESKLHNRSKKVEALPV